MARSRPGGDLLWLAVPVKTISKRPKAPDSLSQTGDIPGLHAAVVDVRGCLVRDVPATYRVYKVLVPIGTRRNGSRCYDPVANHPAPAST
jgi:hypothetical protein